MPDKASFDNHMVNEHAPTGRILANANFHRSDFEVIHDGEIGDVLTGGLNVFTMVPFAELVRSMMIPCLLSA